MKIVLIWLAPYICQLKRFEYIKGLVLESRPFDIEDDVVTATLKKKRNKLLQHYEVRHKNSFFLREKNYSIRSPQRVYPQRVYAS